MEPVGSPAAAFPARAARPRVVDRRRRV